MILLPERVDACKGEKLFKIVQEKTTNCNKRYEKVLNFEKDLLAFNFWRLVFKSFVVDRCLMILDSSCFLWFNIPFTPSSIIEKWWDIVSLLVVKEGLTIQRTQQCPFYVVLKTTYLTCAMRSNCERRRNCCYRML